VEGRFGLALRGHEPLADVVLALFACDFLAHRDEYEAGLRVCGECGRVDLAGTSIFAKRTCDVHG
jgi:hypothetical protein